MIDADALVADTKKQVVSLVDDLRTVAASDADAAAHVTAEYSKAHAAGRTAFGQAEWAEGLYAQVAVAWVLGCVFVRFCEDNHLLDDPLLGGPGIRSQIALDHRSAFLRLDGGYDDRHWLREVFRRLRDLPATGELFGAHNPVWADGLLPSADGARRLREELTRVEPVTGDLRHDFTDQTWDTRFLGDLYQDLSKHAKKTYALLQTPDFVEEFILDRTLDPAAATFGLTDVTVIDPTCGSGHFLLGAFARLFDRWCEADLATNRRELAQRALNAVGGVDLNPFAVSIARFRLLLAAIRAGGDSSLAQAPSYRVQVAVGDSLLHGDPPGALPGMSLSDLDLVRINHAYESEDLGAARELLNRRWCAVVGNPPYVQVRDSGLRELYRRRFASCSGKFTLSVPFMELFWHLAIHESPERSGYVGLINADAFGKAAFGKKVVSWLLPTIDLTHIVQTSGVRIPGHGTPTAIFFGRGRAPVGDTVRVVSAIRGDSGPVTTTSGKAWHEILSVLDSPEAETLRYVSAAQVERTLLYRHPWNIGGGGAAELKARLDTAAARRLGELCSVGVSTVIGEEEPFVRPTLVDWRRSGVEATEVAPLVSGEHVRDYHARNAWTLFPYDSKGSPVDAPGVERVLWPWRSVISGYLFYGKTREQRGLRWFDFGALMLEKITASAQLLIAYKSTNVHTALVTSQPFLAKQTAPTIVSRAGGISSPGLLPLEHAAFVLNSSVGVFWLKQVSRNVGDSTDSAGARVSGVEQWIDTYQYETRNLEALPVPDSSEYVDDVRSALEGLNNAATAMSLSIDGDKVVTRPELDALAVEWHSAQAEAVALQERLDWLAMCAFGLVSADVLGEGEPPLKLGERAFEIVLARQIASGEEESTWLERHGAAPCVELPRHWSSEYRSLVERRIDLIESDPNIRLVERPEHKRRWSTRPWDEQLGAAMRSWLLNRLETGRYWPEPVAVTTVARLTADARSDEAFVSMARLFARREDVDLGVLVGELIRTESVAYLAALRFTDAGHRKHDEWLRTWELQRREDSGDSDRKPLIPPKYAKTDFVGDSWEHRGKLDVPNERFISYPGAERESDASMVIGWAGWNHLDRARALAAWYLQARRDGRDPAYLTPLLAGLTELVPWLTQWYDEPSADPALDRPGTQIAALVETELRSLSLTREDLVAWRPEKRAGRKRKVAQ